MYVQQSGCRRGIAMISTLMMTSVFLMMLAALLLSAQRGAFNTDFFAKREATRYVAEEALAVMIARLREQPDWDEDVDEKTVFGDGRYSVRFSASDSVNNLTGTATKPGPYGPVAAGTALLRIEADHGGYRRTFDALVGKPGFGGFQADAVTVTGRISLRGEVTITGSSAYDDGNLVEANILSNSTSDTDQLVVWRPIRFGDQLQVEGAVELPGDNPRAIDVGPGSVDVNRLSGPKPVDKIDILAALEEARARGLASPPTIVSGSPVPPGEYYLDGDLELPGDLVLDDVKLYVSGKVKIQGSITGRGALFVGGSTTFKGTAELRPSAQESIALMSRGNVELTGFNGSSYMEAVTADAGLLEVWTNTRNDMVAILEDVSASGYNFDEESDADYRMRSLGHETGSHPDGLVPAQQNKILQLTQLLEAQPASPTRDFMLSKMKFLRDYDNPGGAKAGGVFGLARKHHHPSDWKETLKAALREIQSGETHDGLFDVTNDILALDLPPEELAEFGGEEAIRGLLISSLRAFNMDKPGSAYFQGTVMTNGWFYAGHEVSVVGRISVLGDPDLAEESGWKSGPESARDLSLQPGDLQLDGGTKVTYLHDVAQQAGTSLNSLSVRQWLGH